MLRPIVGLVIVAIDAAIPWALRRASKVLLAGAAAAGLFVMVAGVIVGIPLYPLSDLVILTFSLAAGILLGRVRPPRFVPFLVLLAILSVLDLIQVALTSGPAPSPTTPTAGPDPHLIWLTFRLGLPSGHFNIGFADLLLIAACSEHLRCRGSGLLLTLAPGLLGLARGGAPAPAGIPDPVEPFVMMKGWQQVN